jgi:hypothetical protein
MSAKIGPDVLMDRSYTPRSEAGDSERVLLALETARAFEIQGQLCDAARWLRRAADEAERDGNDERVLMLARVSVELTNAIECAIESAAAVRPSPSDAIAPTLASLIASSAPHSPQASSESTPAEAISPPTIPPSDWSEPTIPPPAASPSAAPRVSYTSELTSKNKALIERAIRTGAIPVAVPGSPRNAQSFLVQRLDGGQPLPTGMVEAVLVLTSEIEDILELAIQLYAVERSSKRG